MTRNPFHVQRMPVWLVHVRGRNLGDARGHNRPNLAVGIPERRHERFAHNLLDCRWNLWALKVFIAGGPVDKSGFFGGKGCHGHTCE
jgi:hypothetical protein